MIALGNFIAGVIYANLMWAMAISALPIWIGLPVAVAIAVAAVCSDVTRGRSAS